jgi:hypothetical protein
VFTHDGLEAYWDIFGDWEGGHFQTSSEIGGIWSAPGNASFTLGLSNSHFPILSPDGQRLFFTSTSNLGPGPDGKENVWVAHRTGGSWDAASPLSEAVNGQYVHWQVSVANNGNLYYASDGGDDLGIFVAVFSEGEYQMAQPLPTEINTTAHEINPFIAPDEDYIIFSRFDFQADPWPDLYISFRRSDESWTPAVSMDALNHVNSDENCANVTRDGQYLFFLSGVTGSMLPYWVSAEVIELYRPSDCTGTTGNVDCDPDELIDIGDLTRLIDYLYIPPNTPLECVGEGNIDGDPDHIVDVGDLTRLIAYLYIPPNPLPADCS